MLNTLQALERSARENRLALFQCYSLGGAIRLALDLRKLADCVITTAEGEIFVGAAKKAEVN